MELTVVSKCREKVVSLCQTQVLMDWVSDSAGGEKRLQKTSLPLIPCIHLCRSDKKQGDCIHSFRICVTHTDMHHEGLVQPNVKFTLFSVTLASIQSSIVTCRSTTFQSEHTGPFQIHYNIYSTLFLMMHQKNGFHHPDSFLQISHRTK